MTTRITRLESRSSQAGTALVTALLATTLLFGIAGAYVLLSVGGYENSSREIATVEAAMAAEDGLNLSMAELKSGVDADGDGLGNVTATAADGRTITVTATNLGGLFYRLHSIAVLRRARKGSTVVVELVPSGGPQANFSGAIASNGPVTLQGSIVVDGRDWNTTGTAVVGSGVYGVTSTQAIATTGSAFVGGNGIAPAKPPPAGTIQPFATWTDLTDNDADGSVDEELFDGLDNDADGSVDEDTHGFPSTPDVALRLPPNTLKNAAIASGTYFTSALQVSLCVTANGNKLPGGKVIYCDFPLWQPVNFGGSYNNPPSIVVFHNATATAEMKNVTGYLKGLLITDRIEHFTGTFMLLGGILGMGDQALGNAFGLGNATIRYSSGVLADLPDIGTVNKIRIKSWSRSAAH
jgi:hypothetical protein